MLDTATESITICITYHNEGELLKRSLASALEAIEGLSEFEILIVDDSSFVPAQEIIKSQLVTEKVVVITNREKSGVSKSRNLAIELAKMKYISFLDADDFYAHGFRFQEVMNDLRRLKCSNRQVVIHRFQICYEDKRKSTLSFGPKGNLCTSAKDIILEYLTEVRGNSMVTYVWDKLFEREFLETNKLRFDENMDIYEDTMFSITVLSKCEEVALISRDMITHTTRSVNRGYVTRTLDFLKLSDSLAHLFSYFKISQVGFNTAHLARTYLALSISSWAEAKKGISNIAKSDLFRDGMVDFRAIRNPVLRTSIRLNLWRFPTVMLFFLKTHAFYRHICGFVSDSVMARKGNNGNEFASIEREATT